MESIPDKLSQFTPQFIGYLCLPFSKRKTKYTLVFPSNIYRDKLSAAISFKKIVVPAKTV
jgi:hypothetical protein